MRLVLGILITAVLLFTAVTGLAWWGQERVVFQPPAGPWPLGDGARRVEYAAADGQRLFGYLVTPDDTAHAAPADAPRRVLLAFHGNADLAAWQIEWAREVARRT
ncbi:MAG TPA: hypothetical protein VHQ45_04310, partial [Gemmatimonadaceae bacterium]|nr:hypothetical protein [Gemmatimonadaceae bacterium]